MTNGKTQSRIYLVESDEGEKQLIRAQNPAQAIRYAAANRYSASVATQDELIALVGDGIKVGDATVDPEPAGP